MKKQKMEIGETPRLLVCRFRHLGDIIQSTPVLNELRAAFPKAYISYLTEEKFAPVLYHHPTLNSVIKFTPGRKPFEGRRAAAKRKMQLIHQLRSENFDIAIDLFSSYSSSFLMYSSGAKIRLAGNEKHAGILHTHAYPKMDAKRDGISRFTGALQHFGLHSDLKETHIEVTDAELADARNYLRTKALDPDLPIIGLHPGATWPTKVWPYGNYTFIASELTKAGYQVFVTSRPGEEQITKEIAGGWIGPVAIGDVLPVRQLAAVIKCFSIHVANDCGVMHLAVAVGTKTFGIFGPGDPKFWFPYLNENGHKAFAHEIECRPCFDRACQFGTLDCLKKLQPSLVLDAIYESLETSTSKTNFQDDQKAE